MRTNRLFLMLLVAMLCMCTLSAQEIGDTTARGLSKKELKALEKRKKQQADSIAHADATEAIKKGVYILIVDKTMNGKLDVEDRPLNFVIVENNKILLQTGKARHYSGNNNLGGITMISEIVGEKKLQEKKNGEVRCEFKIVDEFLSGNMKVKLYKNNNYGEIGILHTKTGNYITYFGNILPFTPSMVGSVIEVGKLFTHEGWDAFSIGKNRDVGVLMDYLTGRR